MSNATVYRLRWEDLDRYQSFLFDQPETPQAFCVFDGTPKADWWEPPPVYSESPRLQAPDLWHLWGCATIVMPRCVADELAAFLYPVGELLPLKHVGSKESFLALNILRDVDCLNPESYRIDDLAIYTDFLEHRLPESGLFKVPQLDDAEIFYLERADDEESLLDAISLNAYTGVRFEPVWASDGSIKPTNLLALF